MREPEVEGGGIEGGSGALGTLAVGATGSPGGGSAVTGGGDGVSGTGRSDPAREAGADAPAAAEASGGEGRDEALERALGTALVEGSAAALLEALAPSASVVAGLTRST